MLPDGQRVEGSYFGERGDVSGVGGLVEGEAEWWVGRWTWREGGYGFGFEFGFGFGLGLGLGSGGGLRVRGK